MKKIAFRFMAIAVALSSVLLANGALAATPDVFGTVVQPVGVAATQNEVLVSQPYCVHDGQTGPVSPDNWQIVKFDTAGSQTLFATLPSDPNYGIAGTPGILSNCEETYLAVSTGTGGFPVGHVYATQGGHIYEFDGSGAFVQTLAVIPSLEVGFAHTNLVFDAIGSFGNKLIVVGTDTSDFGEVWSIDSTGATTHLFTLTGPGGSAACDVLAGVPCFEAPDIAPLTGPLATAGFGGFLFAPLPGFSGVAADIGALSPSFSLSTPGGVAVPEATHVVPATSGCGFTLSTTGVTYELFNASFSASGSGPLGNTIYAYRSSDFSSLGGQLLVTSEGGFPGIVVSPDASTFTTFDAAIYNSEGSSFVQCVTPPPSQPFVGGLTWGYWKTHTGSDHPRRNPTYNSLNSTCPPVGATGAITLDGDCDNSSDSFKPTVIECGKASQCSQSADALFAGGNTGGSPNCSGTCSSLFAAQFLATQLNVRAFAGFGNAIYENPSDPRFNGMSVDAIISAMQSDFDAFVDGTGTPNLGQDQSTLNAINNNESHTVLFTP